MTPHMLEIYLKGRRHDERLRTYLSENDFHPNFSFVRRLYYRLARPVLPLRSRQWLQLQHAKNVSCRPSFIWPALVELLQRDRAAWDCFTKCLYPRGFTCAIVLTHDVESGRGYKFIPTVIELERKYGFRSSWNIVPYKYTLHADIIDFIVQSGHEIGIHGYNHDGTLYYSEERFSQRALHINRALKRYGAVGFRSPQVHRNLEWLQRLDIAYDASCFDYDPYQPFPGGTGSIWPFVAGRFIELPYTLPQDHVLFYMLQQKNISIWKEKTKWLAGNHGMVLTLTHPDYLMEKDNLQHYEELLSFLRDLRDAWHCLPREMAAWYCRISER